MPMMIQPVWGGVLGNYAANKAGFIVSAVLTFVFVSIAAVLLARYVAGKKGGNKKKTTVWFLLIALCVSAALLCFFGFAAITVKGILLSFVLLYASYEDLKTKECDDSLHLMIVIAAFIGTDLSSLQNMLISALIVGGLMLISMLITKSKIGGADIKLAAACAFMLGLNRGLFGLFAGTLIAVICNVFRKNRKEGFAMIPYLAVGFMAAYFI